MAVFCPKCGTKALTIYSHNELRTRRCTKCKVVFLTRETIVEFPKIDRRKTWRSQRMLEALQNGSSTVSEGKPCLDS